MSEESVIALGEKFQQLRNRPGKYDGAEYDENVDSFEGEKYKVMKGLSDQLGLPGTPAADVLARLGKPDELTPSLQGEPAAPVMPGPVVGAGADAGVAATAAQQPPYYFVYYWRHKHDYLYFKIDPIKETVITSEWHMTKD
ncbi:hypothetical protein LRAMOSA10297 [Lichtheimia ramosa]|uniref:Uncharacterized protein n=1 Tax=Lichtheimia ramosa TaxID=688394 RepID=A0A077WQG5_9FUNG|nr:hypothetical protein LRAMOSA10297 [Lichtheimia ramosa]